MSGDCIALCTDIRSDLDFLFSLIIEGSVDSDRGSVIDSEEKDEEVSGW